jgi:S1-C subfamily serine protease
LRIGNPYLTIAGQTAPGGGIKLVGTGAIMWVNTHDVVIRYLSYDGNSPNSGPSVGSVSFDAGSGNVYNVIFDHVSGFGLLKLAAPLGGTPLTLGDSASLGANDPAMVISAPGREGASIVRVVSRRQFSGGWEYLLDSAIFTYPAVMDWSGAPLIGAKGELLGLGSLIVPDAPGDGTQSPGNMFVPIDLLKPILGDLIAKGRRSGPVRPWLGINADEFRGRLFVGRVSPDGPAARAGLKGGEIVLAVGNEEVTTLADFYRKLWGRGPAGTEVTLKVLQGTRIRDVTVRSIDRNQYFRPSNTY